MKRLLLLLWLAVLCAPVCASGKAKTLYTFDLSYTKGLNAPTRVWDETHFASTLQGIVNRTTPRLYVLFTGDNGSTDRFWLDEMRREGFLSGHGLKRIPDVVSLARLFRNDIRGLVIYDGRVPATSNVASTVAGVEDLAAVRYDPSPDSLFTRLTRDPKGPRLPVRRWLVRPDGRSLFTGRGVIPGTKTASTGSAKCDAYIWAKEKYLDSGKCDPRYMGYYVDAYCIPQMSGGAILFHALTNHDYIVARRGFFFDLDPWDDETPVDDRGQKVGTDCATMQSILRSAYTRLHGREMVSVSGYIPFWFKYATIANAGGKHEPVYCEFRYAGLLTSYNAFMDADALDRPSMANASVFRFFPLKSVYKQKKPTLADLRAKGYVDADGKVAQKAFVSLYGGDYDSAAWMYYMLPRIWNDPARGSVPIGWAFNPNLAARFPLGMHYARTHAGPADTFVTGASGAGYLHPGYLVAPRTISGLPSGVDAWKRHCQRWMKQFDLSMVGFVIDGTGPAMRSPETLRSLWDAYAEMAPDGFAGQFVNGQGVHKGMPYLQMDWQHEVPGVERLGRPMSREAIDRLARAIVRRASKRSPSFACYRTILWTPSEAKTVIDAVHALPGGRDVEFVEPYALMRLLKQFTVTKQAAVPLPGGVWDIDSSAEVTGHSKLVDGYDIRDILGSGHGQIEPDAVAFEDGVREPYTHWVEWKTRRPVRLDGFSLYANGDRSAGREEVREFKEFRLYGKRSPEDAWTLIHSYAPSHPYTRLDDPDESLLQTVTLPAPFVGSYFRAEFDQRDAKVDPGRGPRVVDLVGIGAICD